MLSSPPQEIEYSIIKPGMHLQRKRNKVIRTYGKRSHDTARGGEEEPPLKKKRKGDCCSGTVRQDTTTVSLSPTREEEESKPESVSTIMSGSDTPQPQSSIKSPSILNFFQPIPSKPPSLEVATTPPSPPLTRSPTPSPHQQQHPKRNPRILRIRSTTTTSSYDSSSPPLQQRNINKAKKKTTNTVQTTLNITSQAAFSECKVCDTVWNPLYPDDVRYHGKRHAAVLRRRRKEQEEEL